MRHDGSYWPEALGSEIEAFAADVDRVLKGTLAAEDFKPRRAMWGVYEQRQDGTYMLRVRAPGGVLSADQAMAIAALALRHGSGTLHLTTRQAVQFHDLRLEEIPALMRGLLAAGLASKGAGGNAVRNVVTCPHAGVCPHEVFDVTPYARAVTAYLMSRPDSFGLPRKFKIAFSGCGRDCALACATDAGFVAREDGGKAGFAWYGGGGLGAASRVGDRLAEALPAEDAIRAAEALRRLFDRLGDRTNRAKARLRFVAAKTGSELFRELVRETLAEVTAEAAVPDAPRSSREELGRNVRPASGAAAPLAGWESRVEWQDGVRVLPQRQEGLVTAILAPRLGQLPGTVLAVLAEFARGQSAEHAVRLLPNQQLALRGIRPADLPVLHQILLTLAPELVRSGPLENIVACVGSAVCRSGICQSPGVAAACEKAFAAAGFGQDLLREVDIRINGCPNACGQHPVGTIGCAGALLRQGDHAAPVYRVLLGARRGEGRTRLGSGVGTVPAKALPGLLVALVRDYRDGRVPGGEPFAEYYDRRGADYFKSLLAPHAVLPAYDDNPGYYQDWSPGP